MMRRGAGESGSRITDLAERTQLTKQTVVHTVRAGEQIAAQVEQRWAKLIGKRNFHALRDLLFGLTDALWNEAANANQPDPAADGTAKPTRSRPRAPG